MTTELIFTAIIVASISIVWRKILLDLPRLKAGIMKSLPFPLGKALTCGFCFTYWTALFFALISNPLSDWNPPLRFMEPSSAVFLAVKFLFDWMIIGFFAITFRSAFVVLQELVDYEMYTLNRQFHDPKH